MVTMNNFETVIVYLFQITNENTYLINIAGLFLVPNAVFISWKAEITHFHFKVLAQNNRLLWLGSFLLHQTGSFISWKQRRDSLAGLRCISQFSTCYYLTINTLFQKSSPSGDVPPTKTIVLIRFSSIYITRNIYIKYKHARSQM